MARNSVRASSQYLSHAAGVISAYPFSIACWFRSNDDTTHQTIFAMTSLTGTVRIYIRGDVVGDPVRYDLEGGTGNHAISGGTFVANQWHHVCAVAASSTSATLYLDGSSIGTDTDSATVPSLTLTEFFVDQGSTVRAEYFSGDIAEVGVWTAALDAAEVNALSKAAAPSLLRPGSLEAYWPLLGNDSPEPDRWGSYNLTLNNAPVKATHPRITYPH